MPVHRSSARGPIVPEEPQPSAQFQVPAEHYDRFMGRYTHSLATALADAAGIRPGMRVLDVGCGPGGLTRELATRGGPGNVAAIDPAPQFAAACRDRNPGADVRTGVAERLPWPGAHFDAALSSLVIGFLHDPGQGVPAAVNKTRPSRRPGVTGDPNLAANHRSDTSDRPPVAGKGPGGRPERRLQSADNGADRCGADRCG